MNRRQIPARRQHNGGEREEPTLTKHACGTCRHFKAANFGDKGWCTNPKRRQGGESLILLRSLELGCRNDWSQDLWQPVEYNATAAAADGYTAVPEAPISIADVHFLTSRKPADVLSVEGNAAGEDIVLGDMRAMASNGGLTAPGDDSRVSLKRAHEEVRLRNREQRPTVSPEIANGEFFISADASPGYEIAEPAPVHPSSQPAPVPAPYDLSIPTSRMGIVSPVPANEVVEAGTKLTSTSNNAMVFVTVPEMVEGFDLPLASKPSQDRVVGRAGFETGDREILPWSDTVEPTPTKSVEPKTELIAESNSFAAQPIEDREIPVRAPVEPSRRERVLPPRQPRVERPTQYYVDDIERSSERFVVDAETAPRGRSPQNGARSAAIDPVVSSAAVDQILNRQDVEDHRTPPQDVEIRPPLRQKVEAAENVQRRPRANSRVDLPADEPIGTFIGADDYEDEDRPMFATSVPRMCRTCRDFRPAENSDRGWCTNNWAFNHRRMVDADELPCETSIGGWWLPNDDVWMSGIDVSAHSAPTPLTDNWMEARRAEEDIYDTERPMRRRQHS